MRLSWADFLCGSPNNGRSAPSFSLLAEGKYSFIFKMNTADFRQTCRSLAFIGQEVRITIGQDRSVIFKTTNGEALEHGISVKPSEVKYSIVPRYGFCFDLIDLSKLAEAMYELGQDKVLTFGLGRPGQPMVICANYCGGESKSFIVPRL
ncbi:Oidioi.mRNA.OKI2018_I69.XSR.g14868.t1.cds [Oikopleura dioica]|uniref:Oidioi.mRNA.OKI2018_I69.XSR.g14868.t1.cds n=1 Tax=Oikopleura dioica TaxID=34765 RepID=A0ABN7SG87_OIKDI|nr:Oidioi.mRNA.OKI2018_I69.XSR.g14868.t1.cds [Oikopleura dioica]